MDKQLFVKALSRYAVGFAAVMLPVFLPAGTLSFADGWLFMGLLFLPMLIIGTALFVKNPSLLEKRLSSKEKESAQRGVITVSSLMFLAGFILAGLDYRFGWSEVPAPVTVVFSVLFLGGYAMYAEVLRENEYLSRTVEVREGQKVIDTGLYGVIRHPMYTATILMFLSMPLILGSWYSFVIFAAYPFLIAARIMNEEKVLENELEGYTGYKQRVRYRLIPYIW